MQHCRKDYNDRFQDAAGLVPPDEPVFLLRGNDKYAYKVVQIYADVVEKDPSVPAEMVQAIRAHAHRMFLWQDEHGSKVPDTPAPMLIRVGE